jgi:hypothetical protein
MSYKFQSMETALLNRLKKSMAVKLKSGYNIKVSPGFIAPDLQAIYQDISGDIVVVTQAYHQRMPIKELNIRETQEAIAFVEMQIATNRVAELKNKTEVQK